MGRDLPIVSMSASILLFQSTRPIWGATVSVGVAYGTGQNFNPRAPYGARHRAKTTVPTMYYFNPRAPYGARRNTAKKQGGIYQFQSTRPIWGATTLNAKLNGNNYISIHAPHMGRDQRILGANGFDFKFQSTRPIWGATLACMINGKNSLNFNPRAPYGARPHMLIRVELQEQHFNPRAPYGARRENVHALVMGMYFNPRAPYGARLSFS